MILWAHNGHIQKTGIWMGQFLKETFGADYISIGFTFHQGEYTAWGKNRLSHYEAQKSYSGTYEYFFASINEPIFLLDLRKLSPVNDANKWLHENLEFRTTGAVKNPEEFSEIRITDNFDIIIFINETDYSRLLISPDDIRLKR